MMTIKNHEYDIGFATPLEWLNEMLNKYGSLNNHDWSKDDDFNDFDEALEFALYLGDDFLNFCDKEERTIKEAKKNETKNATDNFQRRNRNLRKIQRKVSAIHFKPVFAKVHRKSNQ